MYTYIVIDDEKPTRKGTINKLIPLSDQLECIGEASNGKDALELIKAVNPDIIITDMNMPIMDGKEFLSILTELYLNKQIIVISGYKDFEYAKSAIMAKSINYILKPFGKEEIQSSVLHAIEMLKNKMEINNKLKFSEEERESAYYERDVQLLSNLIWGAYPPSPYNMISKKINSITQSHNLIYITLCSIEDTNHPFMQRYLQENGFGDLALYFPHPNNNHIGGLILFFPKQTTLKASELCEQIIRNLNVQLEINNIHMLFGISKLHSNYSTINTAFKETVSALNAKKIVDKNNYVFFDQPLCESKEIYWEGIDELLFRIEAGMTKQVYELMDDLFQYLVTVPHCCIADVKYYCLRLSERVKTILNYYLEYIQSYSTINSIEQIVWNGLFSLQEIKSYYSRIFINISTMLKDKNVYSTKDLIDRIKIYVERNYKNDLTVEFISTLFYINRSYCSHLFKEKTGVRFVDYLNSIRINKSKDLLVKSDKKIYQIAKAVGYDNIKYYFRVFYKLEGITPEQYRKGKI